MDCGYDDMSRMNAAEGTAFGIYVDRLCTAGETEFFLCAACDDDVLKKPSPFAQRTFDQQFAADAEKALVAAEAAAFPACKNQRRSFQ